MQLYYVVTQRRDPEGRPVSGTVSGVAGFENGLYGPVGLPEAERVKALTGADVVNVEIDNDTIQELVNQACEKAGIPAPFRADDFTAEREEALEAEIREEIEAENADDEEEDAPVAEQADTSATVDQILDAITEVVDEEKIDGELIENPVSGNLNAIDAQAVARRLDDEATDLFLSDDESRKTVLNAAGRGDE